jgi:hypothetical protein
MHITTLGSHGGNRLIKAAAMGLVVLAVIWELSAWIIAGADQKLILLGLGLVAIAIVVHILNDWRTGVLLFLVWLLFEDLARKYLGNNMAVYFGKDLLVGVVYISFYAARRKRLVDSFKVPFAFPLLLFFGLGVLQVFNPYSTSILYGLLGLKLYFYYMPLMFLGYAMLEKPGDLERLLVLNIIVGVVIAGLGIAQSVLGFNFLNPADAAPEIYELSHLTRVSSITHQEVMATSSVFVSAGRFSGYLILLWILVMGSLGYLLLSRRSSAKYGFLGIGVVTVAVMITGTRTPFVFMAGSALVMTAAFLWGAPWRWGQGRRMVKVIRRALVFGGIGLILMVDMFPSVIRGNWAFFSETLFPSGDKSELLNRAWDYPVSMFLGAFDIGGWQYGHGIGVCSIGTQYVSRFADPLPGIGVESGYGALVIELGILGLALWIVWVSALLWSSWQIVRRLRETVYFPIAFAIWWYAVVMLVLLMYFGIQSYENFVNNAFLWLLVGALYRLPLLAQMPQPVPIPKAMNAVPHWNFAIRP